MVDLGSWEVSEEFVQDYLYAVGDCLPTYAQHRLAPPVAVASKALGAFLERMELPPGAIHSLQEISTLEPVAFGQKVVGKAIVGKPKRRGSLEFITVAVALSDAQGREVLSSKSSVLVVDGDTSLSSNGAPEKAPGKVPEMGPNVGAREETGAVDLPTSASSEGSGGELEVVTKTISQKQLDAYAEVSGDHNPLHLDAEFAAKTQFGGIIAHGMLTLAFISEMMAASFGKPWLETGALRVRFKGAAYLGDSVATSGRLGKEELAPEGRRVICPVSAKNCKTGQELVAGMANLVI